MAIDHRPERRNIGVEVATALEGRKRLGGHVGVVRQRKTDPALAEVDPEHSRHGVVEPAGDGDGVSIGTG
jgi:hypothetical protein